MKYNPKIHHRQSVRLRTFDYSQSGLYFITICTLQRQMLFGEISNGDMHCNDLGKLVHQHWLFIPAHYPGTQLHDFIVMPNHLHGIVQLVGAQFIAPELNQSAINHTPTVGNIVRGFKARLTCMAHRMGIMPAARIWQRNYHEHIIRNEMSYRAIVNYVRTNPQRWVDDIYCSI